MTHQVDIDPNGFKNADDLTSFMDESVGMMKGVSPASIDPATHYQQVIQHLALDLANTAVANAQLRAKADLVLAMYEHLHIDTWVRQVAHTAQATDGAPLEIPGPVLIPPEEHPALGRFLAAVEGLR